ncbi:T9SS type A sorting domain-containing protein [Pseudobacter ginsenosidimutans]|uniref:Putative secreted protein (Por secretion system target) n=1 Tax=Pseudobacter ginsenosidimutans TaxID=661488 RepID=A0A4Q7MGZ1_9BACT|nr:T9SS type A sorting domain-containing protein [Pseudobacter ginsenosidimutans]RZS66917.1 putative secreted protein (Por secretion system target) [Pseudobacter ginsenosidimutans]
MKATLPLYIAVLSIILFANQKAHAQACSVSNITIKLNSSNSSGGNCQVNVDISWDQSNNNGNKYTNVHVWTSANYPNPAITYAAPPTLAQLSGALGTIVVTNPTLASPTLGANYPPATGATILPATAIVKTYVSGTGINTINRFTIQGINLTIPGACTNATQIIADIWSSNSNSDNGVQCSKPTNSFYVNDPLVSGNIVCNPRTFSVTISSQSVAKTATYEVYADEPVNGVLEASDPLVFASGSINIPAAGNGSYTSAPMAFPNYENKNLWVKVQVTGATFSTSALIVNTCPILPVTLAGFEGERLSANKVLLKWKTATELNNKGFHIQRKAAGNNFETIGFIASAAKDGNSNNLLQYQFTDNSPSSASVQYRLMQEDIDGRQSFSKLIIINGSNSSGLSVVIYPNPSTDGNLHITFSDASPKDLLLTDNSGKAIRSVRSLTGSQYSLQNLRTGLYFLSIKHPSSGETITRKIVVK